MNFKQNIIKLNEIESTNDFAKEIITSSFVKNWTVIYTKNQTKGKGQRGNLWKSKPNENLTFSIIVNVDIKADKQFYISKIISLAIMDFLSDFVENVTIKWPNDIYIADKKIAGILIENIIQGTKINKSIIGIGLNINQTNFDKLLPNPVSLKQLTKINYNLNDILLDLLNSIYINFKSLNNFKFIDTIYNKSLYGLNKTLKFTDKNNIVFSGKILGTDESGRIKLETGNKIKFYEFNDVRIIPT